MNVFLISEELVVLFAVGVVGVVGAVVGVVVVSVSDATSVRFEKEYASRNGYGASDNSNNIDNAANVR